jgi:hypothetical protein
VEALEREYGYIYGRETKANVACLEGWKLWRGSVGMNMTEESKQMWRVCMGESPPALKCLIAVLDASLILGPEIGCQLIARLFIFLVLGEHATRHVEQATRHMELLRPLMMLHEMCWCYNGM